MTGGSACMRTSNGVGGLGLIFALIRLTEFFGVFYTFLYTLLLGPELPGILAE
jgi:hypothetical protein